MTAVLTEAWRFLRSEPLRLADALLGQLYLVLLASLAVVLLGVPLGVLAHRRPAIGVWVVRVFGILYAVPILAMFGFLVVIFGLGERPAVMALVIYGILPVVHNTRAALEQVPESVRDAARGLGAAPGQLFWRVELPLGLPVILAGVRTAVTMNVAVATFAVFIGGGGLGDIVMEGLRTFNAGLLLVGTVAVGGLALSLDRLFERGEVHLRRRLGELGPGKLTKGAVDDGDL